MLPALGRLGTGSPDKPHVAVVGAGAFGGWTALHLLRRGARVTLLDAWGPGNARASSGGETRILRATYGPDQVYVPMVVRALQLWRENEDRWRRPLFRRTAVLWMTGHDDRYEKLALPHLRQAGLPFEELHPPQLCKRFPQINFDGVPWAIYEKEAGYLRARQACAAVQEAFVREGGNYLQLSARPGSIRARAMAALDLSGGSRLSADHYVFACGPWLGSLFPDVIGDRVRPTRQEVFFFGTPPGDSRFREGPMPAWIDNGPKQFYGIPGNDWRGFKLADDNRGPPFDPTAGERTASAAGLKAAREYLAFRFPALREAPLLESRVCQYENSPDGHLILDRHQQAANVVLVGGGSGHGFKLGPAVGERTADLVLGRGTVDPFFALARFTVKAK
jgi:glycine/D-amino acid oxidase-like deaminating enzyme